ncbi:MAPEG family protein [Jannaschia sp. S6380]|uniref:MAPEG family protein n=1 Tax=Jannaschia sp. S6380 TaxID=2926408 RepID=UPI001FF412CF|nr:MAPEG family protein [Jannaschia sp. S6380]MCK0167276.1 MAPEG family protein [Jannaschia sp. S6380]
MTRRRSILIGMGLGAVWSVAALAAGSLLSARPLPEAMAIGLLPGGVVLLALIMRLAARRFFDDGIIDGAPFTAPLDRITQRVLSNTAEQLILAATIWPFVGWVLGGGHVVALGTAFGFSRLAFWVGYLRSPSLRAFGFAGGFYATILALIVAILHAVI